MSQEAVRREKEFQDRLTRFARELSAEMFPEGMAEGMTFDQLEEAAVKAGDEVGRTLVEGRAEARARSDDDGEPGACPECGGPLGEGTRRERRLKTTRGDVAWTETACYCPCCRRGFSPSRPGDGA